MPFSHPPITSQDDGSLAALQNRWSTSQKCTSPCHVISKEVITNLPSPHSKRHRAVHLHYTLHLFIRTFASVCGMPGIGVLRHCRMPSRAAKRYTWAPAVEPLSVRPLCCLFSPETITYSLAEWGREQLAQAHGLAIKPMWLGKHLDKNVNMYSTVIPKGRF